MPLYLLFCSSSIAIQVIVNNKYFGYLISVVLISKGMRDVGAGVADVGVTGTGFLSSSFEQENKIIDKRAYFMVNFILISLNLQVNKLCFFCVKYSCQ